MFSRFYIIIVSFLLIFASACRSNKAGDPLERTTSIRNIITDFELFQNILEDGHPSLYTYLSKNRQRVLFDSIYATLQEETTIREFYNKLFFLTDKIGCSHTSISLPEFLIDTLYNRKYFFPEPLILIEGKLHVNADYSLPHGTEIIAINNRSAQSLLNNLSFYNPIEGEPRETQKYLAANSFGFQYYMYSGASDFFKVSLRDTLGKIKDTILAAINLSELFEREANIYYFDAMDVPYSFHIDEEDNYATLRLTSFDFTSTNKRSAFNDFLKNTFELLRKKPECKNLIIDLRGNEGGYLYECFLLFSYLTKSPFKEYKSVFSKISKVPFPGYITESVEVDEIAKNIADKFVSSGPSKLNYVDSLIAEWEPVKNNFLGNVYIISNAAVMSAASYFSTLVKNTGRGKIVGIHTAGGDYSGNGFETLVYRLPTTKIELSFPYARMLYSFGSPKSGSGLNPDYFVPDNRSSFMKNKDPQLSYIIDSLINKKNRSGIH